MSSQNTHKCFNGSKVEQPMILIFGNLLSYGESEIWWWCRSQWMRGGGGFGEKTGRVGWNGVVGVGREGVEETKKNGGATSNFCMDFWLNL